MLTSSPSIEGRLAELVHVELGIAPERVGASMSLADLGDSLDWVNLLSAVEDEFDLRIDNEQSQRLHTVGDLIAMLKGRAGA